MFNNFLSYIQKLFCKNKKNIRPSDKNVQNIPSLGKKYHFSYSNLSYNSNAIYYALDGQEGKFLTIEKWYKKDGAFVFPGQYLFSFDRVLHLRGAYLIDDLRVAKTKGILHIATTEGVKINENQCIYTIEEDLDGSAERNFFHQNIIFASAEIKNNNEILSFISDSQEIIYSKIFKDNYADQYEMITYSPVYSPGHFSYLDLDGIELSIKYKEGKDYLFIKTNKKDLNLLNSCKVHIVFSNKSIIEIPINENLLVTANSEVQGHGILTSSELESLSEHIVTNFRITQSNPPKRIEINTDTSDFSNWQKNLILTVKTYKASLRLRFPQHVHLKTREASERNNEGDNRRISQSVMDKVWQRDGGKCVKCGSNLKLEFDHIIPFSKGGSNSYRNIQLLCEKCNRSKSNLIG